MEIKERDTFVFYKSFWETYEKLKLGGNQEMATSFLEAVCQYGLFYDYDDSDVVVDAMMNQVKISIDNAHRRYDASVANGTKGGAPKKYDEEAIVDFVEAGHTQREASEKFGCPERTVRRYVKARKDLMENLKNEDGSFNF